MLLVQLLTTYTHACMVRENDSTCLNSAKLLHFIQVIPSAAVVSTHIPAIMRAEHTAVRPAACCWTMCFDVFHRLNCWQWWGDRWHCMSLCGWKKKKKSLVSRPGERRLFRSLQTRLCFCISLNTGAVIIFGLHPATPPSPTHCGLVDFYKVWRVN